MLLAEDEGPVVVVVVVVVVVEVLVGRRVAIFRLFWLLGLWYVPLGRVL